MPYTEIPSWRRTARRRPPSYYRRLARRGPLPLELYGDEIDLRRAEAPLSPDPLPIEPYDSPRRPRDLEAARRRVRRELRPHLTPDHGDHEP